MNEMWACPQCHSLNNARSTKCYGCRSPRPSEATPTSASSTAAAPALAPSEGATSPALKPAAGSAANAAAATIKAPPGAFCTSCGAALPGGVRFCGSCGTRVSGVSTQREPSAVVPTALGLHAGLQTRTPSRGVLAVAGVAVVGVLVLGFVLLGGKGLVGADTAAVASPTTRSAAVATQSPMTPSPSPILTAAPTLTATPTSIPTPRPTPAPVTAPSVQSFVDDFGNTYTIQATWGGIMTNAFDICPRGGPAPGNMFIYLNVEFAVQSGKVMYNALSFSVSDQNGYSYVWSGGCGYKFELPYGTLTAGRRVRGTLVFEVPKGVTMMSLDYTGYAGEVGSWSMTVK
jgi:hypothetical protein